MRSILLYFLLFYISFASSKCLNSSNVSLSTELIPHTSDKRSLNLYKSKSNNFRRNINFYNDDTKNTQSVHNIQNIKFPKNEVKETDESSGNLVIKSKSGASSMVFPFRPKFRLTMFAEESLKAIKLFLVPSKFSGKYLSLLFCSSTLGGFLSTLLVFAASSDKAFNFLRDRWSFQGEMDFGSVETYTKLGLSVFGFDLLFRTIFLRANLIKNLLNPNFFENVNWLGKSLGKVNKGFVNKVLVAFANTVVLTRITFLTYLHYEFMKNNWSTASFLIEEKDSKSISKLALSSFLLTFFGLVVNSVLFGSFNTFMNTEHLLDPMEFRAKDSKKRLFKGLTSIYRTLPESFRKLVKAKFRYSMELYELAKACGHFYSTEIEWAVVFLHASMALNSHSAAGLYLTLLQIVSLLLTGSMDWVEKVIISENLFV